VAFLVALRTGMRAGELCGLTWDRVREDFCVLPVTKTRPRHVPLTQKALRLIEQMRGFDDSLVFGLKSQTLDALFRKYRARAGLSGFTFHDARHTAATWLALKLDVMDLCKAFGWSNPKQAMAYYNPTASDIARRMR
jgi:integrase